MRQEALAFERCQALINESCVPMNNSANPPFTGTEGEDNCNNLGECYDPTGRGTSNTFRIYNFLCGRKRICEKCKFRGGKLHTAGHMVAAKRMHRSQQARMRYNLRALTPRFWLSIAMESKSKSDTKNKENLMDLRISCTWDRASDLGQTSCQP